MLRLPSAADEDDLELLSASTKAGETKEEPSTPGIESAVRVILASPNFLFLFERVPPIFPRTPCIASAIWISPRGYRFSCGHIPDD